MTRVNPHLPKEHLQYNPIHHVTGLFDGHDAVTNAVRDLEAAGFGREGIDLFSGVEGEAALDPSGDTLGTAGRWFRKIENWVSDTAKFHEVASATLHAGGFVVAAKVGTDEALKDRAMHILTQHGARDVKYWSQLYVEQGHEDVPRQNLQREDQ
ncbi:MAG TPA: hypothetical protein VMF13_15690 [Luteitalea sp.]|nr:hypothetical protein [Luteitalea sp.]